MAEKILSKVDFETYYSVSSKYIVIHRDGEEMKIPCSRIKEVSRIFIEDIQQELSEIMVKVNGKECLECGKRFFAIPRQTKYCCEECAASAKRKQMIEAQARFSRKRNANGTFKKKKDEKPKQNQNIYEELPQRNSKLNDLAREARNRGMSYGQLQAMKYMQTMQGVNVK